MILIPNPIGKIAKTSNPCSRALTAFSCSGFRLNMDSLLSCDSNTLMVYFIFDTTDTCNLSANEICPFVGERRISTALKRPCRLSFPAVPPSFQISLKAVLIAK